jgi:hypothetical protein
VADDPTIEEVLDGLALWDEHKPQSSEDWVEVAKRCVADPPTSPSPVFGAAVLLASDLAERDRQLGIAREAMGKAKAIADDYDAETEDPEEPMASVYLAMDDALAAISPVPSPSKTEES